MTTDTPEGHLATFMAKYTPAIVARANDALTRLRALVPGAVELVYDNYNALVVGFGPTERSSDAILSIALYPEWVTLFFLTGATLPDPKGLLVGRGKQVRSIVLDGVDRLDDPDVRALIAAAAAASDPPIDASRERYMVIKSISAKQRPRRPAD